MNIPAPDVPKYIGLRVRFKHPSGSHPHLTTGMVVSCRRKYAVCKPRRHRGTVRVPIDKLYTWTGETLGNGKPTGRLRKEQNDGA